MIDDISDIELITLIKSHNEEAYQCLFFRYDSLCKMIVNPLFSKYKKLNLDYDELIQDSRIALDYAIKSYEVQKGTFFNYWYNVTYRHVFTFIRKFFSKTYHMSIQIVSNDEDTYDEIVFKSNEDIKKDYSTSNLVENILSISKKYLTIEQNKILNLIIDGYSYKDISNFLGVPLKTIDNKVYCLRKEIKKHLLRNKML
ncbi:MAG: hypothetical protein ACI311_06100 [Bacilli bacterium]